MSFEAAQEEYENRETDPQNGPKIPRECWTHNNKLEDCPLFKTEDYIELDFEKYSACKECCENYE